MQVPIRHNGDLVTPLAGAVVTHGQGPVAPVWREGGRWGGPTACRGRPWWSIRQVRYVIAGDGRVWSALENQTGWARAMWGIHPADIWRPCPTPQMEWVIPALYVARRRDDGAPWYTPEEVLPKLRRQRKNEIICGATGEPVAPAMWYAGVPWWVVTPEIRIVRTDGVHDGAYVRLHAATAGAWRRLAQMAARHRDEDAGPWYLPQGVYHGRYDGTTQGIADSNG